MALGPLAASHRASLRLTEQLQGVFGYLGTRDHPRGKALVAYRNALRSIRSGLGNGRGGLAEVVAVNEALGELRTSLNVSVTEAVSRAHASGMRSAQTQLEAYDIPLVADQAVAGMQAQAVIAIMAEFNRQEELARALTISGADPLLIIGDEKRQGILKPFFFLQAASHWLSHTANSVVQGVGQASGQAAGTVFKKQVVATYDGRTTETCLRANGQIREMDEKFHLTGIPRYADNLDWTPFHWWCRSSVVLFQEEFDFDLTEQIQEASQEELQRRYELYGNYRPTSGSPTSGLIESKRKEVS